HEDDSTGLLHYRARYYNPAWARFVSEDTIGLAGGDINLYRYVANNPVQGRDPSGNIAGVDDLAAAALVAALLAATYAAAKAGADLIQCIWSGACLPPRDPASPAIPMPPTPVPANAKAPSAPPDDPANP